MSGPLKECPKCEGKGGYHYEKDFGSGRISEWWRKCPCCGGSGKVEEKAA